MQTGIIYKAENLVNGKVYIGQTKRTLKERIRCHYRTLHKHRSYKFVKALAKYKKEDWKWEILEENIEIDLLNSREIHYIEEFNSYKKGYNSTKGGNNVSDNVINTTIYSIYKPNYGIIFGTISELKQVDSKLESLNQIVSGRRNHLNGWVLAKYKDKYEELTRVFEFYHYKYGLVKCTTKELNDKYFPGRQNNFSRITAGIRNIEQDWTIYSNINEYNNILNILTLEHNEIGKYTLPGKEFCKLFDLQRHQIHKLKTGKCKEINGWKLVTTP